MSISNPSPKNASKINRFQVSRVGRRHSTACGSVRAAKQLNRQLLQTALSHCRTKVTCHGSATVLDHAWCHGSLRLLWMQYPTIAPFPPMTSDCPDFPSSNFHGPCTLLGRVRPFAIPSSTLFCQTWPGIGYPSDQLPGGSWTGCDGETLTPLGSTSRISEVRVLYQEV